MSFERIKSLWRTTSQIKQQSILDKTQNFIASSFRRSSIPISTTAQFEDYLATLPTVKKNQKKIKSISTSTLKPELLKRTLQVVDKYYFDDKYQIDTQLFDRKTRGNMQKQVQMQEKLDEVQVCLFNQISSRFDQILSVLRTIQSLDFLVDESQRKLKTIRQSNLSKVIQASQKHEKLSKLIRKKKNLQALTQNMKKLKQFHKFQNLQENLQSAESTQQFYNQLPYLRNNIETYKKLRLTKNILNHLQQAEANLKRSFSDKVNQKIFEYLKKQIPYQLQFWRKYIHSNHIMEEREEENEKEDNGNKKDNSMALLDQSTLIMSQEESIAIIPKKQDNIEQTIVQFVKKGWEDGQYSVGKFKSDLDTLLKIKHNAFMLDFRNFCDEACKKHERNTQNPSLTNLLKQISIIFCVKVYTYFFDIHKSIILRYFSTSRKILQLIISICHSSNLTIDNKQKLKSMADGIANSGSFLVRIIIQKLVDIIDTKLIHEGIDIAEIKLIVGVLENAQTYIQKQISMIMQIPQAKNISFMSQYFQQLSTRFPVKLLQAAKKRKLMDYLNKMHKNALTIELKQSLQNQIWQPVDIPTFYYDSLHYLITGQSLNLRRNKHNLKNQQSSMMYETSVLMDNRQASFYQEPTKSIGNFRIIRNDIIINGQTYKVTQTLLLLLQMLEDYMTLAQNFSILKPEIGIRINQLIRSYNVSSCQLIIHAGAVALQKIKSKNITSRHLALSSLCLSFILYIMQSIQKRVQILEYAKLKETVQQHYRTIIKKLNQILIYKANSFKSEINLKSTPSKGTQSIVSNTKILFQILSDYYDKTVLNNIFTKEVLQIYVDGVQHVSKEVKNRVQAEAVKDDVSFFFGQLKMLENLQCDFSAMRIKAEDLVRRIFQSL